MLRAFAGLWGLHLLLLVVAHALGDHWPAGGVVDVNGPQRALFDLRLGLTLPLPPSEMIFAPDRRRYVLIESVGSPPQRHYRLRALDGSLDMPLFDAAAALSAHPVWSPDGQHLAYLQQTPSGSALVLFNVAAGQVARLIQLAYPLQPALAWWPDGSQLLGAAHFQQQYDLVTLHLDTGRWARLTHTPYNETFPLITPDGHTIIFMSDARGSDDLYAMPAAGGPAQPVLVGQAIYTPHDLSSDGQWLLLAEVSAQARAGYRLHLASGERWPVPYHVGARLRWW